MWFAWILLAVHLLRALSVQLRVGAKPPDKPIRQGPANVVTMIELALVAGIVCYFL